jgi:hypothetical protein
MRAVSHASNAFTFMKVADRWIARLSGAAFFIWHGSG